jgi:hypothetical protein
MTEPVAKPPRADEVLAAVATRHQPGQVVTLTMVVAAAGISQRTAGRIRRWALSAGLWPYPDGRIRWPGWGHGGRRAMRRAARSKTRSKDKAAAGGA